MTDAGGEKRKPGLIERTPVHEGRIVRLSLDRVRFPDGSEGELEFIRHRGAAAVLPFLDPPESDDPRIVLVEQYRYATGGEILEVPAGIIDPGDESWEACARRELEEETGYRADALEYLTRVFTTPGFTDEVIHLFRATGLRAGRADHDHDEHLEVRTMRWSEALEGVRKGRIVDGKSVAAILYARAFAGRAPNRPPMP